MEDTVCWEIDNLSEKKNDVIRTPIFSSGGCEWCVSVNSKTDHLGLSLEVANPDTLRLGWKRRASYCFVLLNQSGKELYRSPDESRCRLFRHDIRSWGYSNAPPLSKLQEKGFLMKKNKLILKINIKVIQVVHQGESTGDDDMLDYNGFQILASHLLQLSKCDLPDFSVDFEPENQAVKTKYRNLLRILETLSKTPQSLSMTQLCNAQSELAKLTEAGGFKLDWLNSKIEELSVERKKATLSHDDGSRVRQLEDVVKNVELTLLDLKAELDKEKVKSAATAAKVKSAAAAASASAKVSSFQFIDFIIKRFFLSCFSSSKY